MCAILNNSLQNQLIWKMSTVLDSHWTRATFEHPIWGQRSKVRTPELTMQGFFYENIFLTMKAIIWGIENIFSIALLAHSKSYTIWLLG